MVNRRSQNRQQNVPIFHHFLFEKGQVEAVADGNSQPLEFDDIRLHHTLSF